jgi:hypothetical protein
MGSIVKEFLFYEDVGRPLNRVASNLKELLDCVREVSMSSIEFHKEREDFSRWINDVLLDRELAGRVREVRDRGEGLRRNLIEALTRSLEEEAAPVECTRCGATLEKPLKSWSMRGFPNKNGMRTKLTIGFYGCSSCGKKFRRVIAKERIEG